MFLPLRVVMVAVALLAVLTMTVKWSAVVLWVMTPRLFTLKHQLNTHHAGALLQVLAEQQQVVLPAFGGPDQGHLPLLDGKTGQPVPEAVHTAAAE